MSRWRKDELQKIATAEELRVAPLGDDGVSYAKPTVIWSVAIGDTLYMRAYYGRKALWYQAATRQKAGRITAGGVTKEVSFEPVEGAINDRIDDAYRAKYGASSYLRPMIAARARNATLKVMPREAGS
jgi:hypothetical protein